MIDWAGVAVSVGLFVSCVGGMEFIRRRLRAAEETLSPGALLAVKVALPAPLGVLLQLLFVDVLSKPRINMAADVWWWVPAGAALLGAYALALMPWDRWGAGFGDWLASGAAEGRRRRPVFDATFDDLYGIE